VLCKPLKGSSRVSPYSKFIEAHSKIAGSVFATVVSSVFITGFLAAAAVPVSAAKAANPTAIVAPLA
jgi:hypothetical protein